MTKGTKAATDLDRRIGQRIRDRRRQAGLSQEALAGKLNLTFQQVQKYEKGGNRIPASRLATIATILGGTVLDFYDREEQGPPDPIRALLATRDGSRMAEVFVGMPRDIAHLFTQLAGKVAALQRSPSPP
jgi:transcriptional regulator with XRE-family HTH domain